jgi:hypothetical protein
MKNIFLFSSYFVLLCFALFSCEIEALTYKRDDSQFTKQDSVWIIERKDTILYNSNLNREIILSLYEYKGRNGNVGKKPINMTINYNSRSNKLNRILIYITRHGNGEQSSGSVGYSFSQINEYNLIPIIEQPMGLIDTDTNQPINTSSNQYVKTTKLGTHQLNEKTYNDVFVIEDLKKSEVPEIDIFRFYVNPSGILRIEFYDGEVWDRID